VAPLRDEHPPTSSRSGHGPTLSRAFYVQEARHAKLTLTSGRVLVRTPPTGRKDGRAHATGCWGYTWSKLTWSAFGATIGWIEKTVSGWCGNGYSESDWGWGHATYSWGPYCLASVNNLHGWDVYPTWLHGIITADLGVSYPWGCAGISGGHAALRIAANGYHDNVDDWGF
jgi:hypothetical protein